jgi:pyrimidine operon attenuation protein/uracil phosphoribosyltransferase
VTLTTPAWPTGSVRDALDITVQTDAGRSLMDVDTLVGIALRHNPKRAHLLVSTVLAKHVPTVPGIALAAGELLGLLVSAAIAEPVVNGSPHRAHAFGDRLTALAGLLTEEETGAVTPEAAQSARRDLTALRRDIRTATAAHPDVVTLGYAETATGLGQLVADALGAYYLHSTRHAPAGATPFAGFAEEHSHATDHALLPTDPQWLRSGGTTILVDDELSTGTTVINTITALHALRPQRHWVIASLIDLRSAADRARFDNLARSLGTRIDVVCLAAGSITLPDDVLPRAGRLIESMPAAAPGPAGGVAQPDGAVHHLDCTDLDRVRSARFGTTRPADAGPAATIAQRVAALLPAALPAGEGPTADRGVLVLGSEEFIALPMLIADELDTVAAPRVVRFSTSTRSPIATLDQADYPIRSAIEFRSHDITSDGVGVRFAYNLTTARRRFGTVVFLPEPGTDPASLDGPDGVIEAIRRVGDRVVVVLLTASAPTDRTPAP